MIECVQEWEIFTFSFTKAVKKLPKADKTTYNISLDENSNRIICSSNEQCAFASCSCDEALAYYIFENFSLVNQSFLSKNYDRVSSCIESNKDTNSNYECCGQYPERFLFDSNSNRGCCQGQIYNRDILQCCQSGLMSIGTCL